VSDPVLSDPTAPAATAAAPTDALADLVLARLLPAKSSVAPKRLREDLAPFFRVPPSSERVAEVVAALRAAGLVTPKGQQATAAGRARALEYLDVTELPPRANWGTVKARYLVPKALGLSPGSDEAKATADGKRFAALLLKRKLGLPVGTGGTLNAVLEAIACRQLGYPDHATLKSLIPTLLGKAIGGDRPIGGTDAEQVVPRVLLGTKHGGVNGLREVALAGWLDGGGSPEPDRRPEPPEPFDLEAFANTVRSAARTCPTGRFGDNKVFISHVWRQLKDEPRFAPLGLRGFKDKLLEANRENLLTLSRADLYQDQDPADLQASETNYGNAVFHFIFVDRG
jgi:hypothetical protein